MQDINFPRPKVHVFVCINEREGSCCNKHIKPEDIKEIKQWILHNGLVGQVYCTKAQCLGFCNPDSAVAVAYPKGRFVKLNSKEEIKELIMEELE